MKFVCWILSSIVATTVAAPAVVWKQAKTPEQRFLHSSDDIQSSKLLENVLEGAPDQSSLTAVVFLVGKGADGSESLTALASSGKLPQTAEKYNDADGIYHHVSGIESTQSVVREASRANSEHRVLEITLDEFNSKMAPSSHAEMEVSGDGMQSKSTSKAANRRSRQLANASVLVVNVAATADPAVIDNAIVSAVDNDKVESVVLAGVRSLSEVKHERYLLSKRRMDAMEKEGRRVLAARRRLEQDRDEEGEEEGDDAADNNNANDDMSGVYYVHMTPNILAGILFGFLFVVVTFIGVTCMGAISGQDVYVSKMPTIGREA